jgi:hypothetical protein
VTLWNARLHPVLREINGAQRRNVRDRNLVAGDKFIVGELTIKDLKEPAQALAPRISRAGTCGTGLA